MRKRLASILALLALPSLARASAEHPYDPHPPPTLAWMLTQLVPSPELGFGAPRAAFGVRWQLTPILYSWGMYRKLSPWRTFVVEPLTRQSGSIEVFASPENLAGEWLFRTGVHATFPLLERGEKLALTLGAGAVLGTEASAEFEGGFSILFGALGLFVSYAPRVTASPATVMLRFRWF